MATKRKIQTPGEAPSSIDVVNPDQQAIEAETNATAVTDVPTGEVPSGTVTEDPGTDPAPAVVTDPKDDLIQALRDKIDVMQTEIDRRDQALKASGVVLKTRAELSQDGLPHADDVDQNALKSPVLTQEGWLLPG